MYLQNETNGAMVKSLNWRGLWAAGRVLLPLANKRQPAAVGLMSSLRWALQLRLGDEHSNLKSKCLFLLRSGMQPGVSLRWYHYLHQTYLRKAIPADLSLFDAVHRPFFDRQICSASRLRLLRNHFHLSAQLLGQQRAREVLAGKTLELARLQGKNQEDYRISLFRSCAFKREGGLSLGLFQDGRLLQCLSFSFDHKDRQLILRVGGLQSCKQDARAAIRACTKSLHGIQPRLLLIEALRSLARALHCADIECIAKKNHIYQSWRYRFSKTIRAEYDGLWQSAGAQAQANGNYSLPMDSEDTPLSERPSNKRSEYRARDILTTAMRDGIRQNLAMV
ncbi:hypothetical protein DFR42_12120 [Undibacterium pigrum]|uniref:DUF535 domain-containing protein n=1 Tax=Undibacterium pigrum TaxID=401470 RepID=A0A318IXQ8_9BURK|nr:hypothetical protein DFR42_12120 [Undibacterium pigrum]